MGQVGPATGVSTLWGQDAPGTCMGNQGPILAVPTLGICPSDAPPGAGGRDKATCTQVGGLQTSTMTSFLACLKGMGVGTGGFLSQKTFDALGILCPREAPSVLGLAWVSSRRRSPGCSEPPPEPRAGVWRRGQGGSLSEESGAPGALVSAGEGRASPLIHSRSCSHSWAPLPGGRRSTGQAGVQLLVLRPPGPAGEQLPRLPRGCHLVPVPVSQAHRDTHRWGAEGPPELCLLASPGSGGADPRGGRAFPWCSLSCPVWPGLARPP